jgi:group I intron endonuclease
MIADSEILAAGPLPMLGNATWYRTGIYLITNTANGKRYVGSAVQLRKRWKAHRSDLRAAKHHCRHLQNAWNKYGGEAFTVSVLEFTEAGALIEREQFWIDRLSPEYNTLRVAGSCLGSVHTPETRAKISAALMGHKINVGRKHRPETIAKIKAANTGQKRTPEQVERIRAAGTGRVMSPEARAAMSRSRTGQKRSHETRARLAESARRAHAKRREGQQCAAIM